MTETPDSITVARRWHDYWVWAVAIIVGVAVSEYMAYLATPDLFMKSVHQMFPWLH